MTPRIRDVAPPVRDALREVHRFVVHRRPWAEVAAALDAAAGLPDASTPDAAELVALERLEALALYAASHMSDADVERALDATASARTAIPPDEAAWQLGRAVEGRPVLAARHGAPAGTASAGAIIEGRHEPGRRIPVEVAGAIRYGHALRQIGWPHEEVLSVLGEAETLPAAAAYLSVLAFDRIMVGHMYELPKDLMEDARRALERATRTVTSNEDE
jgi:hypothetical protein